ncbi:hypothetical protein PAV19gp28 [Psittacine adenovirus 3]|uniref:Uncharacterized protein n=1 Tax=Psittacine adenovirus 3 TaxID=1580497 RepID=A0A0A7JY08_9ADEN|nr:hypothetical protein SC17_gp28 [Psittacine adenovirus 3]AIZ35789.1 hypothetical protein PAV19gp28 [Psittacine adenovirus 3]
MAGAAGVTDELYHSLIMSPVEPSECFAGLGPLAYVLELNGLDLGAVGAALWDFMCLDSVTRFYVVGCSRTHAPLFFRDLRAALVDEREIGFSVGQPGSCRRKTVVYLGRRGRKMVFDCAAARAIVFPSLSAERYSRYTRGDLCAFLFCANGEDGPQEGSRCCNPRGRLCVKSFMSRVSCGVCFHRPGSPKMAPPSLGRLLDALDLVDVDEGVVAEPLGIPKEVYLLALEESDFELDIDELQISDSE